MCWKSIPLSPQQKMIELKLSTRRKTVDYIDYIKISIFSCDKFRLTVGGWIHKCIFTSKLPRMIHSTHLCACQFKTTIYYRCTIRCRCTHKPYRWVLFNTHTQQPSVVIIRTHTHEQNTCVYRMLYPTNA